MPENTGADGKTALIMQRMEENTWKN